MKSIELALLEQLEALDEMLWDAQFASSQDVLSKLAEEARTEYEQGKTLELDLNDLYDNSPQHIQK